jgi:hypothetical protein
MLLSKKPPRKKANLLLLQLLRNLSLLNNPRRKLLNLKVIYIKKFVDIQITILL